MGKENNPHRPSRDDQVTLKVHPARLERNRARHRHPLWVVPLPDLRFLPAHRVESLGLVVCHNQQIGGPRAMGYPAFGIFQLSFACLASVDTDLLENRLASQSQPGGQFLESFPV